MDEARALLIPCIASLARLQMRVIDMRHQRPTTGLHTWSLSEPHWRVEELDSPSPWLDACAPRVGVDTVIPAIALVQAHLLGMVEAEGPIDGLRACVVLHHLSIHGSCWSSHVRSLAERLQVELPREPRDATHLASLHSAPFPGRQRAPG